MRVKYEPTTISGVRYLWRAEKRDGGTFHFRYFLTINEAAQWLSAA